MHWIWDGARNIGLIKLKIIYNCKHERRSPGRCGHEGKNAAAHFGLRQGLGILVRFERNQDINHGDTGNDQE